MTEVIQERVNRYLQDTISAERNFESALDRFSKAGEQGTVQRLMKTASAKAKTQHERLEALLTKRGGSPSESKTVLAEMLAFTPLSAQIGQGASEKNTQHLIVTIGAAAAEMAMYESLAAAGTQAGEEEVVALARTLQSEERDDYDEVWEIFRQSAVVTFERELSDGKKPKDIITTYLEDAIAAEKSFETQLTGFSKEGENTTVQSLFRQHADETHLQYERLTDRLRQLGGSPSVLKSLVANVFGLAPKVAQMGHDQTERLTQNLMMAFAVENAEVAMYEALAQVANAAGDSETEQLAKAIQKQEQETADKVWAQIAPAATQAIASISTV